MVEAKGLVSAIRDQVGALDGLDRGIPRRSRAFPRPQFEEDSVNDMVSALTDFRAPARLRAGHHPYGRRPIPTVPSMADRSLPAAPRPCLNLIKNGLEALSQGGSLTVTTRRVEDNVEIAVSDSGPGITEEVGRRLFEQFFTTKPQGSGLGLSITRQIATQHGGQIQWSSQPGAGATFTITLPIKRPEHA
jgi:nitrogen-specific signal transduction histidine kinase